MGNGSWGGLRAGEQIGNLEYAIDDDALAQYRLLVGSDGCFPNLIAEDCRAMLERHAAGETLTTVWQRLDFLRPPIMGRRIQVGGWVRELREERCRPWIKMAAFAVDEIGTEILRSEAAFELASQQAQPGAFAEGKRDNPTVRNLARGRASDGGHLGRLRLPAAEELVGHPNAAKAMFGMEIARDGNGLTSFTAGWLESLLGGDFGEDFRWGGRMSIAYHRAVSPGVELCCDGVVIGHDTNAAGVETRRVIMSVWNAADYRVATAEAVVQSPSPRLL